MALPGADNVTAAADVAFHGVSNGLSLFMQEPLIYIVGAVLVAFGIATVKGFFRLRR